MESIYKYFVFKSNMFKNLILLSNSGKKSKLVLIV